MIELSVQVSSPQLEAALTRLVRGVRNLKSVMDDVGQALESRVSARFETETDPTGQAWAAWSPGTTESYPNDGARGRILERYGTMLESLYREADVASVRVGLTAVASRSQDVYAVYHEFGTQFMPRRGLLTADPRAGTLGDADERAVLEILEDHLQGLIG